MSKKAQISNDNVIVVDSLFIICMNENRRREEKIPFSHHQTRFSATKYVVSTID